MKLIRLDLLRYGHLSDVTLDFPADAALHVVHGANEAGKSTALAAIADALFGFAHRTDFDFLHGAPQLRVGFGLRARDGAAGYFVRRKGRRDTLRDAADQPVPEDALARFLGGASRELFERGFGLNGARLRQGGGELLRSGGDAGASLLAGTGLLNVRAAASRLEDEEKSLFGDGRGRRLLSEAVDKWREAQREIEERAVAPRAWQDASTAQSRAVDELDRVQQATRALTAENSRLQRVRRVAPLLAELDGARDRLGSLADAPHFPPDAERSLRDALAARRDAERDAERESADAARLAIERAGLPQDAWVLAAQDAIDALEAQRSVVLRAAMDLPGVRAEVAGQRGKVAAALEELGAAQAPEAARDTVPSTGVRRTVQRLVNRYAALTATAASTARALAAARRLRDQAASALRDAPAPPAPDLLRRTIDAVRGQGPLDAELDRAELTVADAARDTAAAVAALPLWHGDIAALAACRLPLPAETDVAAARLDRAEGAVAEARAQADGLAGEIATLEEAVSRLGRGETVPTPDAVAAARSMRDQVWRLIRRVYEGGPLPEAEERAGLSAGPLPEVFETLRDDADRLSDRRADDAQRVADYLAAGARLALLRGRRSEQDAALEKADDTAARAMAAWRALWEPAGLAPKTPPAMTEWRHARAEVLRLAGAEAEARSRCDGLALRRARARAALAVHLPGESAETTLPGESAEATLADMLLRAEAQCATAETAVTAHRRLVEALAREEARLPELEQEAKEAAAALDTWRADWAQAVAALGLSADAAVDDAEAVLGAWQRIGETAPAWQANDQRIREMTTSIESFAGEVRVVQERLGETATDEPPAVVAARLARRLGNARKAAADAADLAKRMAAHAAAAADAALRRRTAEAELDALRSIVGTADDGELERAIERARERDRVTERIAHLGETLLAQGDGHAEAALRDEAGRLDADAVVARLAEIDVELAALGERREQLSADRATAESTLAALRTGQDAAAKAQEAEDALADARAHAERYARLHIARVLLRAGVERFRKDEQGPLLRRAGAHFALLTDGRYVRLEVDQEPGGRVVLLAIRDTGIVCAVEALSEGARDQLYLALRVASIEVHAARAEPLPFIADDLLVNFDDARAAAAIALLAELGRSSQVILFTHHDHIAALAAAQAGAVIQKLPALASPATSPVIASAAN
jgi:chromosome segregation protein